jgi:NADPH:quinone reductase-like Zn-dependent oxidoreductase
MKAIRIHQFGGPEVLKFEDAPRPEPASDEVLIKVHATSVNPIDWKIREGRAQEKYPVKFPLIPGWDVSGEIEEVGSDIVVFRKGDEVYARPDVTRNGTYAEYVVVKANEMSLKPVTIDHVKAAAVPLAGLTAWQALFDHGELQEGQKVLIHGATGGVVSFAVQFAKWKGAYVIGTASTGNIQFLKKLGADETIDYKKQTFEDIIRDVDLVIDLIGGDTQERSLKVIRNGGRLVSTVAAKFKEQAKAENIHLLNFQAQRDAEVLEQIATLIDEGKVTPVIGKLLPLEKAAEAQKISEQGHTLGKIVLEVV